MREITMEEVEQHYTEDDFWTVVDGVVYDLSGYSKKHPGGTLIMNAAGTDTTVMFYLHHFQFEEQARKILNCSAIGKLVGRKSPKMGEFWTECAKRVKEFLKDKPQHPRSALMWWVIDHAVFLAYYCVAWFSTRDSPLWLLVVMHAMADILPYRCTGQQHVTGHAQVLGGKWQNVMKFIEHFISFDVNAFQNPTGSYNPRRKLNEPRKVAQKEICLAGRGQTEHLAVHHTYGAELEYDTCFVMANAGYLRLAPFQTYIPALHKHQAKFTSRLFSTFFNHWAFRAVPILVFMDLWSLVFDYIPRGEFLRIVDVLMGFSIKFLWYRGYGLLYYKGWRGALAVFWVAVIYTLWWPQFIEMVWVQHIWDHPEQSQERANEDWGRVNARTTWSYQGSGHWLGNPQHWGYPNEGGPTTTSYHLEHTLFPGVCWVYYPLIAPVIERCAAEFGVAYNKITSDAELKRIRVEKLRKYSVGPSARNTKED